MLPTQKLYSLYQDYNRRFFRAELSKVKIEYSEKMTRNAGLFSPKEPLIRLSMPLLGDHEQDLKDTLIHEMIHVAQWFHEIDERPHGPYFSAQMARINQTAQGEVIVTVTHNLLDEASFQESSMLGKIKKLLALSDSPNENEAYAAAQKVQTLMADHGVELADLKTAEAGSELDEPLINEAIESTGTRITGWKFALLEAICRVNYCKCLGGGQHGIRALGRKTHVEICRSYYQYFVHVVESEASRHRGKGRVFLNRFREAMVHEIGKRLKEQFQQINGLEQDDSITTSALSLANQYHTELEQFVQFVYPRVHSGRQRSCWADKTATQAGQKAGAKAQIAKHIVPETRRLGQSK